MASTIHLRDSTRMSGFCPVEAGVCSKPMGILIMWCLPVNSVNEQYKNQFSIVCSGVVHADIKIYASHNLNFSHHENMVEKYQQRPMLYWHSLKCFFLYTSKNFVVVVCFFNIWKLKKKLELVLRCVISNFFNTFYNQINHICQHSRLKCDRSWIRSPVK